MAKRKISPKFRLQLSEKLMDLGNFSIAGLVFGQFVSGKEFSKEVFILGIVFGIICYVGSYILSL